MQPGRARAHRSVSTDGDVYRGQHPHIVQALQIVSFRVLILRGYGQFVARLATILSRNPVLQLVMAGRSLAAAQAAMLSTP